MEHRSEAIASTIIRNQYEPNHVIVNSMTNIKSIPSLHVTSDHHAGMEVTLELATMVVKFGS